jgi:hypothetical protein
MTGTHTTETYVFRSLGTPVLLRSAKRAFAVVDLHVSGIPHRKTYVLEVHRAVEK